MIHSIYELRTRLQGGGFHIDLSIPKNEYARIYGNKVDDNCASEIVQNYLQYKDDDGEPRAIKIYDHDGSNLIEIEAILDYTGNNHKEYDVPYTGVSTTLNPESKKRT